MRTHGLVVAKAPVAGSAKTRLGAVVGMSTAADLAAAALLDTLAACREAFGDRCHLALEGDLALAARSTEITAALEGWDVFAQAGEAFGERLAHAHGTVTSASAGPGGVVQVGMDTPQVSAAELLAIAEALDAGAGTVLGPAEDGGWWALGLDDGARAAVLREVAMSRADTFATTRHALAADGSTVALTVSMRDVDTVADAAAVAALAPDTRFARAWSALEQVAS
ncbi:MAG: DUF2064 domain-containing protein [Marmoricola sp.]